MNILIVDDHPFIIQAYKNALEKFSQQGYDFTVTQANNCQSGYENIDEAKSHFDVAFFDISMPEFTEKEIYSGEDLATFIKKVMPNCKVILLTMHTELLKINNIAAEMEKIAELIGDISFLSKIREIPGFTLKYVVTNQSLYL